MQRFCYLSHYQRLHCLIFCLHIRKRICAGFQFEPQHQPVDQYFAFPNGLSFKLSIDLKTVTIYNQIVKRYPKYFLVPCAKKVLPYGFLKYVFVMEVKAAHNL
jgi:hypothetical protein